MRKLTLQRAKSYVEALTKLNIYIEDSTAGDIMINGTRCRKLGDLENGERKTFGIEEHKAKVFAIAENASPSVGQEYYELPEGVNHIFLSGQLAVHPSSGIAFRFDGNDREEADHKPKKSKKKRWMIISAIAIAILLIGGIAVFVLWPKGPAGDPKTFTHEDMSITLTDKFEEVSVPRYVAAYQTEYVEVFVSRQGFYQFSGLQNYTAKQYAKQLMGENRIESEVISKPGKITYFTYTRVNTPKGLAYKYYCYVYKTNDAFWSIQFGVPKDEVIRYEDQINEWARSVEFD